MPAYLCPEDAWEQRDDGEGGGVREQVDEQREVERQLHRRQQDDRQQPDARGPEDAIDAFKADVKRARGMAASRRGARVQRVQA